MSSSRDDDEANSYRDGDGDRLVIAPSRMEQGAVYVLTETCGVRVPAVSISEIVARIYKAAGLPVPVILERPGLGAEFRPWAGSMIKVSRPGKGVRVEWDEANGCGSSLPPAEARAMAAALAAYADEAEAEPNPSEVDKLAAVLMQETGATVMGLDGTRPLARKILLAGYARERRDA